MYLNFANIHSRVAWLPLFQTEMQSKMFQKHMWQLNLFSSGIDSGTWLLFRTFICLVQSERQSDVQSIFAKVRDVAEQWLHSSEMILGVSLQYLWFDINDE